MNPITAMQPLRYITLLILFLIAFGGRAQETTPNSPPVNKAAPAAGPITPVSVTLNGPSTADLDDEVTYYLSVNGGATISSSTFNATGGTIESQTLTSVTVRWVGPGTGIVSGTATVGGQGLPFSKITTVTGSGAPTPDPPTVSTNTCGDKTLTRGTLFGYKLYWQTHVNGISTAYPDETYTVISSRTVYLRARHEFTGLWGEPISTYVTVNRYPDAPPAPVLTSNNCGLAVLSRGTPPSGETWYWQSDPSGTSTTPAPSAVVSCAKVHRLIAGNIQR